MNHENEASSSKPTYRRGKYKTYRAKYHAQGETTLKDTILLIQLLEKVQKDLHDISPSQQKSVVIENIQALLDRLRKHKRKFEDREILQTEEKLEQLEKRIGEIEQSLLLTSQLSTINW